MVSNCRNLEVYQRAFRLAVEIHKAAEEWPKYEQFGGMGDQIRRASKSICATMAEGLGKHGISEQRRYLNMAIGSASEMLVWVDFTIELGYVSQKTGDKWKQEFDEISRMIFGLIQRRNKELGTRN